MKYTVTIFKVLAEIGSAFPKIAAIVGEAIERGADVEDIEQLGYDAAKEIDIKAKVNGVDVVDEDAEAHLLAAVGLILRNIVKAKSK